MSEEMRKIATMSEWKKTIKKEGGFQRDLEQHQKDYDLNVQLNRMSAQVTAASYLEDKQEEFNELEKLHNEYQDKGRKILEKIWDDNKFDENSKEFRHLEKLMDEQYEELGISPQY